MSTLRIAVKQQVGSDQVRNVFHVAGAFATIANAQDIVDYIAGSWAFVDAAASMLSHMAVGWSLYGADVKDVADPANPTIPFGLTLGTRVGTNAGERLPLQNAALLTFKALTAKPNASRKYLAGWTEGAHDTDGWSDPVLASLAQWGDRLLDMETSLDAGAALVVTRYNEGVLVGSNILDHYVIGSYARTQRRRTPGRGI